MRTTQDDQFAPGSPKDHAAYVSVLAFRCAFAEQATRELASAKALKAYLNLRPHDGDAADRVVDAIAEAIRLRPHWVNA